MKVTSSSQLSALPVVVGPGLAFPESATVRAEDFRGFDVVVRVVPSAGQLTAASVEVLQRDGGPPVTGEAIRAVPVARLVREAGRLVKFVERFHPSGRPAAYSRRRIDDAGAERLRQGGPTDEALDWVAYAYRVALVLGDPPTAAVEQALKLPRSTAGRWVALARERGFLGKAEGAGKARA